MSARDEIAAAVRGFILEKLLGGQEDPQNLDDATPLVSGGILDSIATYRLVAFLEERYHVRFAADELDAENLETVARIAALVERKR